MPGPAGSSTAACLPISPARLFAYISYYHVPPRFYGLLFGAGILGIMVTNLVNARLVVRFGIARLLRAGTAS